MASCCRIVTAFVSTNLLGAVRDAQTASNPKQLLPRHMTFGMAEESNASSPSLSGLLRGPQQNGSSDLTTAFGFSKNELTRLLVQTMDELGFCNAARTLEADAHVLSLSSHIRNLRETILHGRWADVDEAFRLIEQDEDEYFDQKGARFVVYEQQFLEFLDDGRRIEALQCLRENLANCCPDPEMLHKLPLLCMTSSREELRKRANWAGAGLESRVNVLRKLQRYISPNCLLPESRLQTLLQQSIENQKRQELYPYTKQKRISLLEDLSHCFDKVPQRPSYYLKGHSDEVWFVQFSHSGKYLASASKDTSIIVWNWAALKAGKVSEEDAILHCLKGHAQVICLISWSPDDKSLLSCGRDKSIRLWDMSTGSCLRIFLKHSDQVTTCVWMPDGQRFVSGAVDRHIYEWDAESGDEVGEYFPGSRVNDMAVSADGRRLIVVCADNVIQVFDTTSRSVISRLHETMNVTSISLASDGNHLLVNTSASDVERPEIHLWNLSRMEQCRTFHGFKQKRYVIRACFGGADQILVLCGSEDSFVHMWSRYDGKLLARLQGHTATVNSVAWSPTDIDIFASGSDDKTVIVWSTVAQDT